MTVITKIYEKDFKRLLKVRNKEPSIEIYNYYLKTMKLHKSKYHLFKDELDEYLYNF